MKIFLDTNVLLDAYLCRENYQYASMLLGLCDSGKVGGYVSILSIANIAYVIRKGRTQQEVRKILSDTSEMLSVLPMDNAQLQQALTIEAPDIEDVLQYECAKANGCDIIVTGNIKHFKFSDIPVKTIDQCLRMLLAS